MQRKIFYLVEHTVESIGIQPNIDLSLFPTLQRYATGVHSLLTGWERNIVVDGVIHLESTRLWVVNVEVAIGSDSSSSI